MLSPRGATTTVSGPAFRHDPVKSVVPGGAADPASVRWTDEPIVCGYRRLEHENPRLGGKIPVPVSASPAVVPGIGVVLATDDGRVRLFDRTLEKVYWERRMDSSVYASLVVDPGRRHVVVVATSGLVACFDLRGTLVWSARAGAPVCATPTILPDTDVLVLATFHGRCVGLRLATGEQVFERRLPDPWHAAHGGTASYRDPYASPATTEDGNVVVCCAEHVLCLAPDGTELWRQEVGTGIKASPVALHRTAEVAVCPVDGRCLFLDSRTGSLAAELFLGTKTTGSPAVSGDVLAVGTQDSAVTALDTATHGVRWTSRQGGPRSYTSFTVLPSGDFAATTGTGNVMCLRREDGRFRWETSQVLGLPDHEPTMDITPVVGPDGSMYCASYTGVAYHFRFRPAPEGGPTCR
ncbi:PQQ-binding-like beta-propeller repeat protein [Kitasatospora cinereorecta]|uniref:PQQ-binding-like beta-propeller repeat protein n=1 Tax=Kitasatospora cinereorecta TaxID=285560 RepID=A0ABW0V9G0_9ACTN